MKTGVALNRKKLGKQPKKVKREKNKSPADLHGSAGLLSRERSRHDARTVAIRLRGELAWLFEPLAPWIDDRLCFLRVCQPSS